MATITRAVGSGPLKIGQIEALAKHLIQFRVKALTSEDSRASNVVTAIDTLLNELYTGNTTNAQLTTTYSNTANASNQYAVDHWKNRD